MMQPTGFAVAAVSSKMVGRSSRKYVVVQIDSSKTVKRDEKSNIASILGGRSGQTIGLMRRVKVGSLHSVGDKTRLGLPTPAHYRRRYNQPPNSPFQLQASRPCTLRSMSIL